MGIFFSNCHFWNPDVHTIYDNLEKNLSKWLNHYEIPINISDSSQSHLLHSNYLADFLNMHNRSKCDQILAFINCLDNIFSSHQDVLEYLRNQGTQINSSYPSNVVETDSNCSERTNSDLIFSPIIPTVESPQQTNFPSEEKSLSFPQTQVTERQTQFAKMETQLAERQTQFANMETQLAEMQAQLANMQTQLAEMRPELANMQTQLAEMTTEIMKLNASLNKQQKDSIQNFNSFNNHLHNSLQYLYESTQKADVKDFEETYSLFTSELYKIPNNLNTLAQTIKKNFSSHQINFQTIQTKISSLNQSLTSSIDKFNTLILDSNIPNKNFNISIPSPQIELYIQSEGLSTYVSGIKTYFQSARTSFSAVSGAKKSEEEALAQQGFLRKRLEELEKINQNLENKIQGQDLIIHHQSQLYQNMYQELFENISPNPTST